MHSLPHLIGSVTHGQAMGAAAAVVLQSGGPVAGSSRASMWVNSAAILQAHSQKLPVLSQQSSPMLITRRPDNAEIRELDAQRKLRQSLHRSRCGVPPRLNAVKGADHSNVKPCPTMGDTGTGMMRATGGMRSTGGFRSTGMSTGTSFPPAAQREDRRPQFAQPRQYRHVSAADRRMNCQNALAADSQLQKQRLQDNVEAPFQREARQQQLKSHRWNSIFSDVDEDSRDLLPARFCGRIPLLNTDDPTREFVKSGSTVTFTSDQAEALVNICIAFQNLAAESDAVPQELVLTRSPFCQLICALQGLSMRTGGRTLLSPAAQYFDAMATKVYHYPGQLSTSSPISPVSVGSGRSVVDAVCTFGYSLIYATTVKSKLPEFYDLPICALFGQLIKRMAEDACDQELSLTDVDDYRSYRESLAKVRLFEELVPVAQRFSQERAALVRDRLQKGGHAAIEVPISGPSPAPSIPDEGCPVEPCRRAVRKQRVREDVGPLQIPRRPPRFEQDAQGVASPVRSLRGSEDCFSPRSKHIRGCDSDEISGRGYDSDAGMSPRGHVSPDMSSALYAHTFAILKGELLQRQFLEPELLHFVAEFRGLFTAIFHAYRDIPVGGCAGHMSLLGFLSCCDDFGLFPRIIDYKTAQWLFDSAEGCTFGVMTSTAKRKQTGSKRIGRGKRKTPAMNADGFLFHGKWLRNHLAWLVKGFENMSSEEAMSASILWAMSEWIEGHRIRLKDVFFFLDEDGTGTISLSEFETGTDFMCFDDPPSTEDLIQLMRLVLSPAADPVPADKLEVDLTLLGSALQAIAKMRDHRNRATNCFLKDFRKMTRMESNACVFLSAVLSVLDVRQISADEFFDELDTDGSGEISHKEMADAAYKKIKMCGISSSAVSVEGPLEMLDANQDGSISRREFTTVIDQVRQARDLKNLYDEMKHPIFLSSSASENLGSGKVFGLQAFIECMLKIAFIHLGYHGNYTQAEQPSFVKAMWLLVYMHSHFNKAKEKADKVAMAEAAGSMSLSPQGPMPDSPAQTYPKCMMPMQRLLKFHPNIFTDGAQENPKDPSATSRPGSSVATVTTRPVTQEVLSRLGWGQNADAVLQRYLGSLGENGMPACGETVEKQLLSAVTFL